MILVSACLLGVNCKYDGKNNYNRELVDLLNGKAIVPVCPEQLGGLTTPRIAAEIQNGDGSDVVENSFKVLTKEGVDVSEAFIKGAKETLYIAMSMCITQAFLKAKSPSCGSGKIYDGTFSGVLRSGDGVTTYLLKKNGIKVFTENDFLIE
ncbi:DUF523 domain-containing protein [Serpentinicella alkaliphila]|nr:DUF523 domain-containing protein [Serpentinicella alkaliphila]QUH27152.1 DUF523 domain-containing protein [Serpentinicella alkaliphila]